MEQVQVRQSELDSCLSVIDSAKDLEHIRLILKVLYSPKCLKLIASEGHINHNVFSPHTTYH